MSGLAIGTLRRDLDRLLRSGLVEQGATTKRFGIAGERGRLLAEMVREVEAMATPPATW